jgi:glutamate-ammonia-ligase adenylyltransferase
VVTGAPRLQQTIRAVIRRTLTAERDPAKLIMDVADMRDRLAAHHRANSPWDVKHRRGGLVDVEFITQYLQLRWAHEHPDILRTNLGQALEQAGGLGLLTLADADTLHRAWQLWSSLQQTLRLTFERDFREKAMTARVRQLLAEAAQCGDFTELKAVMSERADQVSALYRDLIDGPARTLRSTPAEDQKNDD